MIQNFLTLPFRIRYKNNLVMVLCVKLYIESNVLKTFTTAEVWSNEITVSWGLI